MIFQKSSIKLGSRALALKSNPEYPYVAVGYDDGMMEWFSVYNPMQIKSMVTFQLTRNPINSIYFTQISKIIVAANLHIGQFFILEVSKHNFLYYYFLIYFSLTI